MTAPVLDTGADAATGPETGWTAVCGLTELAVERGATALVAGEQIALFRLHDGAVHAVQQLEPHTEARVMSRGLVGTRGDVPVVVSPLYKQVFDLRTGECLDTTKGEPLSLTTWSVEVRDDVVLVGAARAIAVDGADA